jgi:general secretion pathway protein F
MPKYRYRALDASGQMRVGFIEAASTEAVLPELERLAVLPIEISDAGEKRRSLRQRLSRGPTREEITGITEDLAALVRGGLTLDRALLVLSETSTRPALAELMLDLHRGISAGHSLAEAVSTHPDRFPPAYTKMVEVAELAGTLDETLLVIAHERRRGERLRRRIMSALTYPTFLIVAAGGVLVFVLVSVIPEFERALTGLQSEMQGSTQLVFALSHALRENLDLFAVLAILVLLAIWAALRSSAVKSAAMQALGRVPGLREILHHEQAVSFCATLGTLSRSGVDITTSLRLIRDLMRDRRSAEKIDRVVASVRQGHRVSEALAETGLLPVYAVHMLRVGEESGELDSAAVRVAGFYEEKLDRALTRLTGVLGPAIIILVSLLIAWLIVSVMTALLSMNELIL